MEKQIIFIPKRIQKAAILAVVTIIFGASTFYAGSTNEVAKIAQYDQEWPCFPGAPFFPQCMDPDFEEPKELPKEMD